ncbi:NAD(P)-binding domain-containing protein [Nitrosomonas sp. Is37]|uniref:NAD(P)-binding domain-containing protein n=1 Tax=Nitrosomonas sp. Is37 TaxID=3080535 RepID=UPI00294B0486|nr:NAD(P)-binding domain-containing protein [Nitrosomonas sp. Is37]MDV6343802.1 NAD(P)-binding domain-containing protein [Nitrosomonas sp. Is37]
MVKLNIAVIGFGRVGRACALALRNTDYLAMAGVVRRPTSPIKLPDPLGEIPVVTHVRDLKRVDVALICVPADVVLGVARELLQAEIPVVECAVLEGHALEMHYDAIGDAARHHNTRAIVGAGWNPGMLPLFERAFTTLIPDSHTKRTSRPGASLHHTEVVEGIEGVKGALATETRDWQGQLTRYVYVELAKGAKGVRGAKGSEGASLDKVEAALAADPLFVGEQTHVFEVESIATLEEEGRGIMLERIGTERTGAHATLLLEGRFDVPTFAARVMLDAAKRIPSLKPGAHRYSLWG